ncbi:MAG: hypothetical protein ACLR76_06390 [Alistipes sp.]
MKKLATLCLLFAALAGAGCTGKTEKIRAEGARPDDAHSDLLPQPNEGVIRFKVGDEWITNHDYGRISTMPGPFFSTIQQAGINDVIIDLTNPSQWAET